MSVPCECALQVLLVRGEGDVIRRERAKSKKRALAEAEDGAEDGAGAQGASDDEDGAVAVAGDDVDAGGEVKEPGADASTAKKRRTTAGPDGKGVKRAKPEAKAVGPSRLCLGTPGVYVVSKTETELPPLRVEWTKAEDARLVCAILNAVLKRSPMSDARVRAVVPQVSFHAFPVVTAPYL